MNGFYVFVHLSNAPVVMVAIYAAFRYAQFTPHLRKFALFLFLNAIIQALSLTLNLLSIPNLSLLHILVPVGFYLLATVYNSLLSFYLDKRIIKIVALLFVQFSVLNSVFFQPVTSFNSNALTVESILILILTISLYLFLMSNQIVIETKQNVNYGLNWINSGLFIYHSSSLIIFYFGKIIIEQFSRNFALYTWVIHSVFSIIMYICFFIGLWKQPKN